ncbi:MAG TPA: DUF1326 domain-containing protein [Candidatus Acidoferrales bacterium]|nr:DUF1326 domain-containing protein [Candidatus Acidoferrales bacterium]
MRIKSSVFIAGLGSLALAAAAVAAPAPSAKVTGQYIESRTADVWTGPCVANSELNLAGKQAVMAWHIDQGTWDNVSLDGLSVVAVVRAQTTLGDPDVAPSPARALLIVDQSANEAQRAALAKFAQAQGGQLLSNVVATEAAPITFATNVGGKHASASLVAGNMVRVSSRAIGADDELCHNEDVFYQPLATHLTHAMPAVATESTYRGSYLGGTWSESGRRGVFVGSFSE